MRVLVACEFSGVVREAFRRLGCDAWSCDIQPWQFGHGEVKATCLWLKHLPKLAPTKIVSGRVARVHHASPGPDRWKERSRTLPGIAEAMAASWAHLIPLEQTK